MLKIIFSLSLFFSLASYVLAQNDFRDGYIINNNYDTIYGLIDYRGDLLMSQICKFKLKDGVEIKYNPGEIIGYRFIDDKLFVSKEVDGSIYFLEFLIKGEVNIYYLRTKSGDQYYIEKEGIGLEELFYEERIEILQDRKYRYKSLRHIGILNLYMQDAPELKSRIEKFKKPEHSALIKLAKDYHENVCKEPSCIIYSRIQPRFKFDFELVGGLVNYKPDNLKNNLNFQSGILTHIWLPRTSEKLFLRTGFLYSNMHFIEDKDYSFIKIPIHIEYVYPKGIIKPRLSYGVNFYNISGGYSLTTNSVNGGVNIKTFKSVQLNLSYEIDFLTRAFILVPSKKLSDTFYTGISIGI